nr:hypothetical protein [Tanacetum cinerariifolium]
MGRGGKGTGKRTRSSKHLNGDQALFDHSKPTEMVDVSQPDTLPTNSEGLNGDNNMEEDTIIALFGVPLSLIVDVDALTRKIEAYHYVPINKDTSLKEDYTLLSRFLSNPVDSGNKPAPIGAKTNTCEAAGVVHTTNEGKELAGSRPNVGATAGISMAGFKQSGLNFGPIDEATIIQSVSIKYVPNSYVGAAGVSISGPSEPKANFCLLFSENLYNGVKFSIPRKLVEMVSTRFDNPLYGYFISKRVAFLVVEYYARNKWENFGLTRIMMNSKVSSLLNSILLKV